MMKKRRAAVLLFVLGMFVLLSYVLVHIMDYAQAELKSRGSYAAREDLRQDALNALYAVIAELEEFREIDGGLYSADQGWGGCLKSGRVALPSGSEAEVKVSDLRGKLSLPNMTSEELARIFEYLGVSVADSKNLADCLLDWTDSDDEPLLNGAEKDAYSIGEALPPNRALKSFSELFYVKHFREHFYGEDNFPNARYEAFTRIFSLENFPQVNLNSASEEVLEAMCEAETVTYDERLYGALRGEGVSVTDGITWVKSASDVAARGVEAPSKKSAYETSRVKIEITIKRGVGEYYLSAVYGSPEASTSRAGASARRGETSASSAKILELSTVDGAD